MNQSKSPTARNKSSSPSNFSDPSDSKDSSSEMEPKVRAKSPRTNPSLQQQEAHLHALQALLIPLILKISLIKMTLKYCPMRNFRPKQGVSVHMIKTLKQEKAEVIRMIAIFSLVLVQSNHPLNHCLPLGILHSLDLQFDTHCLKVFRCLDIYTSIILYFITINCYFTPIRVFKYLCQVPSCFRPNWQVQKLVCLLSYPAPTSPSTYVGSSTFGGQKNHSCVQSRTSNCQKMTFGGILPQILPVKNIPKDVLKQHGCKLQRCLIPHY